MSGAEQSANLVDN